MGPVRAVGRVYANMLNFSGRARRAEYWWFQAFLILLGIAFSVVVGRMLYLDPAFQAALAAGDEALARAIYADLLVGFSDYALYGALFQILMVMIPNLAVTVRRLHDTDRSGWFMFVPGLVAMGGFFAVFFLAMSAGNPNLLMFGAVLPALAGIWLFVVLCLPGTHGNNRFGPDPATGRKRPAPAHPAFAPAMDGEAADRSEVARKAAASDYYKRHVLPSIQKPQAQ